jgi:putative peptidoglycan lipid II flippase
MSVAATSAALFYLAPGIVGFGLFTVTTRACYALNEGRGPLIAAAAAMGINFVLSFILAPVMESGGPALASSVSISAAAVILAAGLGIKLKGAALWEKSLFIDAFKMLLVSAVMFGVVWFIAGAAGDWGRVASVAVCAVAGLGVYGAGCLLLKVPEAGLVLKWLLSYRLNI